MVVPNRENERTTPSVVLFDGDARIVGNTAKESAVVEPDRVAVAIKQHIGDPNFSFNVDDLKLSPEEISALILRKLVNDAAFTLGLDPTEQLNEAVITCPAHFSLPSREATIRAGQLAGLQIRAIVDEPIAAALAYGLRPTRDQVVLVYDLGGGTFDLSIVEFREEQIRVIATGGDPHLGGLLWDEAIVMELADRFREASQLEDDPRSDPETLNDLFLQAERGRKTLTQREKALFRVTHGGRSVKVELSRDRFEEITISLLDRTIDLTRELINSANSRGVAPIETMILVGGATRMPQVHRRLQQEFQCNPVLADPEEAVAKGAALFGLREVIREEVLFDRSEAGPRKLERSDEPSKALELTVDDWEAAIDRMEHANSIRFDPAVREVVRFELINSSPRTLGVIAVDSNQGVEVPIWLIPLNAELPARRTTDFGTEVDEQRRVEIQVIAGIGESANLQETDYVGLLRLQLPEGLPARSTIRVTFDVGLDGRISVSALELTQGDAVSATFDPVGVPPRPQSESAIAI